MFQKKDTSISLLLNCSFIDLAIKLENKLNLKASAPVNLNILASDDNMRCNVRVVYPSDLRVLGSEVCLGWFLRGRGPLSSILISLLEALSSQGHHVRALLPGRLGGPQLSLRDDLLTHDPFLFLLRVCLQGLVSLGSQIYLDVSGMQ